MGLSPEFEQDLMLNFIDAIQRRRDNLIFNAFEHCGYSREWLLNNINRVSRTLVPQYNGQYNIEIYSVDGVDLFRIWNENTSTTETELIVRVCVEYLSKEGSLKNGK